MSGMLQGIYAAVIRRNTTFLGTVFIGAFATELIFETGANKVWDRINAGRQWKDIKYKYMEAADDE